MGLVFRIESSLDVESKSGFVTRRRRATRRLGGFEALVSKKVSLIR
jgi:hypothetical protein